MKRFLMAVGLGLMTGSLYAACMGPFCYDQSGASVAGVGVDGNGFGMPSMSSATINGITPKYIGQEVFCNSCVASGGGKDICVSTETVDSNAWVRISSPSVKCQ